MPEQRPPIRAHPAKPFQTWRDEDRQRLIVTIRCGLCRKVEHYLPEDLARIFGPDHPSHVPPFSCGRCRTADYLHVTLRLRGRPPRLADVSSGAISAHSRSVKSLG